jgi:hypothetical protein
MKELVKSLFHTSYKPFSKMGTRWFSNSFINTGYFIQCEAFYNSLDTTVVEDRIVMHEELSSKYVNPSSEIHFLEFGVFRGQTFKIWVNNNKNENSLFSGFDTFTGLPEDWGNEKKGSYSAQGNLPDISDSRVNFETGLIQDTLPVYLPQIKKAKRKVVHIDVDLYNATLFTLIQLQPLLLAGDIIIFDDFFSITKGAHEFRAFYDFLALYKTSYKPIMKCRRGHLAIEVV